MKRFLCLILILSMTAAFCGCGNIRDIFEKEFVAVEDYSPPSQPDFSDDGRRTVADYTELYNALMSFVDTGLGEGIIVFPEKYNGDIGADLEKACLQIRLKDALCAYCVDNISYNLNKIFSICEAVVHLSYSKTGVPFNEIHRLLYPSGLEQIISESLENGDGRVSVLVSHSGLSPSDVGEIVASAYRANPGVSPTTPKSVVRMLSGSNNQRLYEISFSYGFATQEMRDELRDALDISDFTGSDKEAAVLYAYDRLKDVIPADGDNVYDALVKKEAGSEGTALAFTALCNELGVECRFVRGQYFEEDYCWNIVRIGDNYYHVVASQPEDQLHLRSDASMVGAFKWNTQEYPACNTDFTLTD